MADNVLLKNCPKCRVGKDVSQFYRMSSSPDGFQRWCKPCQNSGRRERDEKYIRSGNRAKTLLHKHYMGKFGLSLEEVEARAVDQGNVCAICVGPPTARWNRLYLDHNHQTGKVRGLLCDRCNRGLGLFGDNAARIANALIYLLLHEEGSSHS